ncbi:MAG TPA: helix-turn-helix transcriptional regulator [Acidobacteriota bacterium]|nr:helix-turn-helix transcriptional regulator [Acidobacteriota bacterium]
MAKKDAGYTIGVVAQMYEIHPQTLRTYEREGLLSPSRSRGNTRLFGEEDLQRLELILSLTRELGVNLAGVEVILHMRERIESLQGEFQALVEYVHARFGESEAFAEHLRTALTRVPDSQLIRAVKRKRSS